MLSKPLKRSDYLSTYERYVCRAFRLRKSASKCPFPLTAKNLDEQASECARKATQAMQALAMMG